MFNLKGCSSPIPRNGDRGIRDATASRLVPDITESVLTTIPAILLPTMVLLYHLVFTLAAFSSSALAQTCATVNPAYAPTWGSGFSGRVLMNGLKSPRGIVFDSENNLLVVESGGSGVRYVKLTDNGGTNVCVASSKQLIDERGVRKLPT